MDLKTRERVTSISVPSSVTILHALKRMDALDRKSLLIFEDDRFKGILSIGDIQRAIIRDIELNIPVSTILRGEFTVASVGQTEESIKKMMLEYRTECMPVLDGNRDLVDVYFWEDIIGQGVISKRQIGIPVVIMAGGQGARLRPLTNVLPKPLIPIGEKTIIEMIMESFSESGCDHFYVSLNYKASMIEQYLLNSMPGSFMIEYLHENEPLGTVGALHMLKGKLNSTFFVSNCDILIKEDYAEILSYHVQNGNALTIVAALKHFKIPYGTLDTKEDGVLVRLTEKPELTFKINAGLYILEPDILEYIPCSQIYDITDLVKRLIKRGKKVGVFPVSENSWSDIGEIALLKKLWNFHG